MTIQRMDNVGIVVNDLDAAVAFFTELGMELGCRMPIEGSWALDVVGLDDMRSEIAMMRIPDAPGRLELAKYPRAERNHSSAGRAAELRKRSPVTKAPTSSYESTAPGPVSRQPDEMEPAQESGPTRCLDAKLKSRQVGSSNRWRRNTRCFRSTDRQPYRRSSRAGSSYEISVARYSR